MSGVAALVLATAGLHAGWNTAAKSVGDRWVSSALIGSVYAVVGIVVVVVLPLPESAAWPFVVGSVVLQVGYLLLLTTAYEYGDMICCRPNRAISRSDLCSPAAGRN